MHIEKLVLRNVLRHADTTLDLPARGVVALTGANGHGKSSLLEAVSVALWGATLRGTSPWAGPDGHVYARIRLGGMVFHVTRAVVKGRETLSFYEDGGTPVRYETTTKAQAVLEQLVGAHDVWRRASVFSSSDADAFSGATDGERKRMLESVLGVDRFEPALRACRADLQKAETAAAKAERDAAVLLERLAAAAQRKIDAETALAGVRAEDVPPLEEKARLVRVLLVDADRELSTLRAELRAGERRGADAAALARQQLQATRALRDSGDGARCPTCDQALPDAYRARLVEHVRVASGAADEAARAAKGAAREAEVGEAVLAELLVERDTLVGRVAEAEGRLRAAKVAREQHAQAAAVVAAMATALSDYQAKAEAAHVAAGKAASDAAELRACERVLGLRGPRAQIVARALGGLEAVTNGWLARLAGPGLRVKLSPFTETKTAGVADKIAFEVLGAGGGHGYRAASGGERRRLDVALLLALGDFVAAANGCEAGTLFADEIFDALDDDGRVAVAAVLRELAAEGRCVVVVTHLGAFVRDLAPDAAWRVDGGVVARA